MCEVYTQTTMKHQKVCPRGEASVRCVGSAPRVRFMGAQRVRDFSVHMCTYVNGKEMCVSASCLEVQAHPLSVFRTLYSGKDGDSTGGGPYMLGKQYTIADVAIWTWLPILFYTLDGIHRGTNIDRNEHTNKDSLLSHVCGIKLDF